MLNEGKSISETIKEKSVTMLNSLSNDNGKFTYWDKLLESFENDPDYNIIKFKMNNLVNKLNSLNSEELKEYMNRDFEIEIWDEI